MEMKLKRNGGGMDMEGENGKENLSTFDQPTLVKYEYPVVVSTHEKSEDYLQPKVSPRETGEIQDGKIIDLEKRRTEEMLNVILPPREWEYNGKLWRQRVSSTPATRTDVITLEEQLNVKLKQRQARPFGICPIRRELYSQCFDELIRQVTINCAERGFLLMKIRDEANMTLKAYRRLYESATAHGIRKILMTEAKKTEFAKKSTETLKEKAELELEVRELETKLVDLERAYVEQKEEADKKHEMEMTYLRDINEQIKHQLESIIIPPKKNPITHP